jgi:hypothetical protein
VNNRQLVTELGRLITNLHFRRKKYMNLEGENSILLLKKPNHQALGSVSSSLQFFAEGLLKMMTQKSAIGLRRTVYVIAVLLTLSFSLATETKASTRNLNEITARLQSPQKLSVPADSLQWNLEGQAKAVEYQGRKSLFLDGGGATLKDFEMRDGVIDVDVSTPASRGFFGIQFRLDSEGKGAEWVYLRQHKSGAPDAMQYTPVLNTGLNWQIYNGPGFTGAVDIPKDEWFHMRLEVVGAQAKLFVKDMEKPALVMNDLKSGNQKGLVALAVLTGATYFSNFEVRTTPDAAWERRLPAMPAGTLTKWSISPSYDALARNLELSLSATERNAIKWEAVEAEAPGFVVLYRYREAPHPRVTFANDFSKRLDPQPGMQVLYAKTNIDSDREQVKKLYLGYSDDVSVFLNGKILYRGRSAQNFRDPAFLGIINPDNDIVYLPLKKGSNELMLALSELGGGWGFICRLADMEK